MSRFRNDQLRGGNQAQAIDLDPGFIGVNNKLDPSVLRTGHAFYQVNQQLLGPGTLVDAINVRLSDGIAETRDGYLSPIHLNQPWWSGASGGDYEAVGSGVYSDPNGMEWLMLAVIDNTGASAVSKVFALRDDSTVRTLALDTGLSFTSGSRADMVQGFADLIVFRGDGVDSEDEQTPLTWDGDWTDPTFREVPQTSSGRFEDPIPNAASAVTMSNRLLCASGRDTVAVSDILDFTRWDSALNEFRVNEGSDDRIVALIPWRKTNLLVMMEQSVHLITGVTGDLSAASVETVNRSLGIVGPRAWAYIGGDVAFLSQDGIYRISEAFENTNLVKELPMSDPVEGYIRRINPLAIHLSVAIADGSMIRWALPIDGASRPNAILTFDATTQTWMGLDRWTDRGDDVPAWRPDRLHRIDYLPSAASTSTGQRGAGGKLTVGISLGTKPEACLLEVPGADADTFLWTSGTTSSETYTTTDGEILTDVTTRGYVWQDLGVKQCRAVRLALETYDAEWTVRVRSDGYNEETDLSPSARTVDRTVYQNWGQTAYTATNANDDFDVAHRDDYSVILPFYPKTKGVVPGTFQSRTDAYPVRSTDRWTGFRLVNTQGRIKLKAIEAEALMTGPHSRELV